MTLFDEARKKAEAAEKKRVAEKERIKKLKKRRRYQGQRREIWIAPDGSSHENQIEDSYEEDLSKLPLDKLNRRFVLSFLNVHGKLFTKIGMETFLEMCSQMLQEFQTLLQQAHPTITCMRILQLMAINMFMIGNTALKESCEEGNGRSLLQEHAVQLGLDMFAILVERCAELLHNHLKYNNSPQELLSYTLSHYMPAVKVWADWMICHPQLWMQPPNLNDPDLGPNTDVWESLAKLCNVLIQVDISHDIARDCLRIQTLQMFGDYLCGIEPPMLSFNVETKQYYSVAPSQKCNEIEAEINTLDDVTSEEEIIETEEDDELVGGEEDNLKMLRAKKEELKKKVEAKTLHQQNIQMLRAKREQLQKEVEQQTNRRQNIQAILQEHRTCSVEVEIRPMYLLPDTNCFIDHLSGIQKLVFTTKYTISVPLIVINELDGLARGNLEGHYDSVEHSDMVKENAKQAMAFLEEQFDQKNPRLRAQTTKGNMLDTIVYRSETTDTKGNNDDLILACCLHYCKDHVPKVKDGPIRLERDVVLLTDDRNLRLKAHTYNVPVKDVPSFLKWCKVT
ncbi:SMG6 [Acanthosepion pharaonis]|uniref:SMG6 n=1 Tax=Acanthosepion pharaonis TaxID=158019 RepID=A0A812EGY0_ACAPH|nr:SMG6 [Sepia pharaonis]